jgi:hypothetical protein
MPGRTRKIATGRKGEPTESAATIDSEELEAFRATLPEYRRYETYRFLTVHWDIVRALYLIHKQPREPRPIDVAMFARNYGFFFVEGGAQDDNPPEVNGFFSIDTKTVLSDLVDLTRPLLIALIAAEGRERPYAALIDGLHRLFKAAWRGKPQLPAYVLTPDEERSCRI